MNDLQISYATRYLTWYINVYTLHATNELLLAVVFPILE